MTPPIAAVCAAVFFAAASPLFALPEGSGARPAGMGGAFGALADDANAVTYNPAGLSWVKEAQFTADYSRPALGLDDKSTLSSGYLGLAVPLRIRKRLSERVLQVREMDAALARGEKSPDDFDRNQFIRAHQFTKNQGTLGLGISNLTLSGAASENTFALAYSRKILRGLSGGFAVKWLYHTYTGDSFTAADPVFSGGKSSSLALSFDAGLLYNPYPRVFWGLSATDLNRPNTALSSSGRNKVLPGMRAGVAFRDKSFKAAADGVIRDDESGFYMGAEKWMRRESLALRGGAALGLKHSHELTAGASVRWGGVQADYAFGLPIAALHNPAGNHKITFSYLFGKPNAETAREGSLEMYYSQIELESEILKTRLEKAEADRKRLETAVAEEATQRAREKTKFLSPEERVNLSTSVLVPEGMKIYITESGDTLEALAEFFYGNSNRWPDLYHLNRERVGKAGRLKKGTLLLVPEKLESAEMRQFPPQEPPPKPAGWKPKPPPPKKAPERPKIYVVQEGDTLRTISQKIYGNPGQWKEIYQANRDKVERGWVEPGEVLVIP